MRQPAGVSTAFVCVCVSLLLLRPQAPLFPTTFSTGRNSCNISLRLGVAHLQSPSQNKAAGAKTTPAAEYKASRPIHATQAPSTHSQHTQHACQLKFVPQAPPSTGSQGRKTISQTQNQPYNISEKTLTKYAAALDTQQHNYYSWEHHWLATFAVVCHTTRSS